MSSNYSVAHLSLSAPWGHQQQPHDVANDKEMQKMGLFKGMKDLKAVVAAAPAMMEQGQAMAANAQAMQAAQMAQMQQSIAQQEQMAQPIAAEHLQPIAVVDLPT